MPIRSWLLIVAFRSFIFFTFEGMKLCYQVLREVY